MWFLEPSWMWWLPSEIPALQWNAKRYRRVMQKPADQLAWSTQSSRETNNLFIKLEDKNRFPKVVLWPLHTQLYSCTNIHTIHTQTNKQVNLIYFKNFSYIYIFIPKSMCATAHGSWRGNVHHQFGGQYLYPLRYYWPHISNKYIFNKYNQQDLRC